MASLSGKADGALVRAATDAAMANVPVDVSKIHERISKSNAALAKSTGEAWGSALKVIGEVGTALVSKARKEKDNNSNFENNVGKKPTSLEGVSGVDPTNKTGMVDVMVGGKKVSVPSEDRFKYDSLRDTDTTGWQELATFSHVDSDDNSSDITVGNTDQFAEKLRDDIYELNGKKEEELKNINSLELTGEEKSLRKKEVKANHKKEKKRLKGVKSSMDNSNVKFAQFYESLNSQLNGGIINMKASGMYGANKMRFAEALQNKGKPLKDGSKAVQGYNEDGNLVFAYVDKNNRPIKNNGKDITLAEGDVGSLLIQESPKRPLINGLIDIKEIRKNTKYGFDEISSRIGRGVENEVTDKNTFLDLAFYRSENTDGSLADNLHNVKYTNNGEPIIEATALSGVFIDALSNIGSPGDYSKENPHPYDQDGDGDFDKEDYNSEGNYLKLTKQALSGDDLEFSKSLLKQHYQQQAKVHFDRADAVNNPVEKVDGVIEGGALIETAVVEPEKVFQGSRNPSGIFVNKADQVRIYESVSDKKQEINGADGSFYVLSGDKNSYMQFKGKDENTPKAGRELYYFLNSKKGALVGKRGLGIDVSFEQMLENNAAYSTKLPGIQTQKEIDKENEGLTTPTAKEIKDSIDGGEQSAFNRGPDGKLLPEGYTLNDLGEVVEVEGNQTSTKVKSR